MTAKNAHNRRYNYEHKQARKRWTPIVERGGVDCHRCGKPIRPGTKWHLDHHDDGTGSSPSHAGCNTATAKIWRDKALGKPAPPAPTLGPCKDDQTHRFTSEEQWCLNGCGIQDPSKPRRQASRDW